MAHSCAMLNLDHLADKTTASSIRMRVVDLVSLALWAAAVVILVVATAHGDAPNLARWGILVGLMALASTMWCVATWIVDVIRMEIEVSKLSQLSTRKVRDGS